MPGFKKEPIVILAAFVILFSVGELAFPQAGAGKEIRYSGGDYRDPLLSFIPAQTKEIGLEAVNPPNLKLQGIVWGGPSPRAIINNTVLGKGDIIQGARILDVKREGVEFIFKGENFLLERSGVIKTETGME